MWSEPGASELALDQEMSVEQRNFQSGARVCCMKTELTIQNSAKELKGKRKQLRALIEAHPFMQGLGRGHLATLADCAMKSEFDPGQLIFREGDVANRFYVILQGKVALEAGSPGA